MRRQLFRPLATTGTASALLLSAALAAAQAPPGVKDAVKPIDAPAKVALPPLPKAVEVMKIEVAPPRPEVLKRRVEAQNAQIQAQLVQQFTPQFRGGLRIEYQLLLTVCKPNRDQRREIARAGERAVADAAARFANWQQTPRRVVFVDGVQKIEPDERPDVRKILKDALAAAAKEHLSADQAARFLDEVRLRKEDQTRADVRNLVAKLDQTLLLSPDQRDKIAATLAAHANEDWSRALPMFANNDTTFTPVPDKYIVPFLSGTQVRVWLTVPKAGGAVYEYGFLNGMGRENVPLADAELGEGANDAEPE